MFKSFKDLAGLSEKSINTEFIKELAQFEKLINDGESIETTEESGTYKLGIKVLSSGRRVICPHRQSPSRNRKHLVRSLLIHQ